jgi:hypothetical protein
MTATPLLLAISAVASLQLSATTKILARSAAATISASNVQPMIACSSCAGTIKTALKQLSFLAVLFGKVRKPAITSTTKMRLRMAKGQRRKTESSVTSLNTLDNFHCNAADIVIQQSRASNLQVRIRKYSVSNDPRDGS